MEEWVCCNKCYRSHKESNRTFALTQCQHIFCSQCVVGVKQKCPECKSSGVSTMTLERPLQQSLLPYFRPLSQFLQQANQVAGLQQTQALIVLRRFCEIEEKYASLKKGFCEATNARQSFLVACKALGDDMENRRRRRRRRRLAAYQARKRAAISNNDNNITRMIFSDSRSHNDHWEQKQWSTKNRTPSAGAAQAYRCIGEPAGSLANHNNSIPSVLSTKRSYYQERENAQRVMEHEILSRRLDDQWRMNPTGSEHRTDFQPYDRGASSSFAPHQYQPRAILSDDSAESPVTPVHHQQIRSRIPGSVDTYSSTVSSSDGTPNAPKNFNNHNY